MRTAMTMPNLKLLRDQTAHFLTPEIAACAGLTLGQLQQVISGSFTPSEEQLRMLARRMGMRLTSEETTR